VIRVLAAARCSHGERDMKLPLWSFAGLGLAVAACTGNPNGVVVELAPAVVSSLDGTLSVHTLTLADRDPVEGKAIAVTVDYTDRNGMAHAIAEVDGKTDKKGEFDATLTGLMWDGTGTVHAKLASGPEGDETFAVLDRTPPKVTIEPATIRTNNGADVMVHATDEIGISQVFFQVSGADGGGGFGNGNRSLIASGAGDVTLAFQFDTGNTPAGTVLTLYALAADLSGNEGAATPLMVTVSP
jgi:hypothetical protein